MIQEIRLYSRLQSSCTGRVKVMPGGPGEGCVPVVSAGKEKNNFFKSRCEDVLFNFESILTLKGPGFSDSGTAR